MKLALEEANACLARDEVPIGAVLVDMWTGEVIAKDGNRTREHNDPSAHAEMLVLRTACQKAGAQRVPDTVLYVTLEPCAMCAAALSYGRVKRVVFGASDPKSGGVLEGPALYTHAQLHHKPDVTHGIGAAECGQILSDFFQKKRLEKI